MTVVVIFAALTLGGGALVLYVRAFDEVGWR